MPADSATRTAPAASATPATVAVFEARRFDRALAGSVVPAKQWQRIDELDALPEPVNALYAQAGKEIEQAREQGTSEGFVEGLSRVQQQMFEQPDANHESRDPLLAEDSRWCSALRCAILTRKQKKGRGVERVRIRLS